MDINTIGLIIAGITLVFVIIGFFFGPRPWTRKEKVKIKFTISYRVPGHTPQIKVYWGDEFLRSGGKEIRYTKRIVLKPDKHTYRKLCKYFALPKNGEIEINERLPLPRDVIVSSHQGGEPPLYPDYAMLPGVQEKWNTLQKIASELSQKTHKVGLVWEDSGKTTWKKVPQEKLGKWV